MKRQETVTAQPKDVELGYPATASPYFNGSSDQIDIPYAIDLNPSSFTVEMWVQFQGGRGYRAILTSVSGSASLGRRGYVFCINPAQQWQFWLGSGQKGIPWIILTGWKAKEGVWTHLAGTYDSLSETMILYVNGQAVGQWTGIQYQPNDRNPMHVGAGATEQAGASSCFFHGSISQVRIWERSLSSAEIQIAAERSPDDRSKETATPQSDQPEPQSTKSRGRKQSPTPSTSEKQTTQKQRATASAQSQPTKSRGRKKSPTPSASAKQTTQKQRATAFAQSQPTKSRGRKQSPTPPPQTEQTASSQSKQSESTQPKESLIQPVLVFNGLDDDVEVPDSTALNPS